MQYVSLRLGTRRIDSLNNSLLEFKTIQNLDLSGNNIVDINLLQNCDQLVSLYLSKNKIKNINVFTNEELFPKLRILEIAANKYTELPAIKLPKLERLDISENKLEKHENWGGHANIRVLKSVDNKFKSLSVFKEMPKLEELYMQNNPVPTLVGWDGL